MQTILQDRSIRRLAQTCATLSHKLGKLKPPSAFIQSAMFIVNGEGRLRDKGSVYVGAVELELLGCRDALRVELQSRRTQPKGA
jgi:hypothetical protein